MNNRTIIFFDIDGVIFDGSRFLSIFCEKITLENNLGEEAKNLKNLYQDVKDEKGFFDPQLFLDKISFKYSIANELLEKSWWSEESFAKCLLINEDFLKEIQKKAVIGIFSKGEINFQKKKIEKFMSMINPNDVHIFEDKIIRINEVLSGYKNYKVYIVDDSLMVLESFKKADNLVSTILVNKERSVAVNNEVDVVIERISEVISLLAGLK